MKPHLKYFVYVCKHKYFVFRAGLIVGGIPLWRLIIHDYTKFSNAEWGPYVRRFFSGNAGKEDKTHDPDEFKKAFEHHWKHNPHHWEYWVTAHPESMATPMPEHFLREMVADWLGAGRGITGSWNLTEWYEGAKNRQNLHIDVRLEVENLLDSLDWGQRLDKCIK